MIYLTRKDEERTRFVLNHRMIERIEHKMDTMVWLDNGKKIIVDETAEEIIEKIKEYEADIQKRIRL